MNRPDRRAAENEKTMTPNDRLNYLAHLSRWECPTCGHGLDIYVDHCGESESHLARRTQAAARQRLAELHHCEPDQLDEILVPPDPRRRRWHSPIPQDAPPDVLVDLLRALIASAGITQGAAARLLGVAPRTVRGWLERGERRRQVPWSSVELLRRLLFSFLLCVACCAADEWTGPDKDAHAIAGLAIGGAVRLATETDICSDWPYWKKSLASLATVAAIAGAKEIYDKPTAGDPSWKDFAVTIGGGLIGDSLIGGLSLSIGDDAFAVSTAWRF